MRDTSITWKLDFNDPDPIGWATFAAYGLACTLCIAAARKARRASAAAAAAVLGWRLMGWSLFGVGLNKELDLQVLLAQVGRKLAIEHGWYEHKLAFRFAFLAALGAMLAAFGWRLRRATRGFWTRYPGCIVGILLLCLYVTARAVPWSQVFGDSRPGARTAATAEGARPLWGVEVGGILLIAFAAGGSLRPGLGR